MDGHRADIFMLKVAQTLAAYRGREEVSPADVREAATLVLPHRLRRQPFSESEMDENRLEETFRKHAEEMESRRAEPPPPQPGDAASDGEEAVLVGEVVGGAGGHLSGAAFGAAPGPPGQKGPGVPHPDPERRPHRALRPPHPGQAGHRRIWPLTPPSGPRPPTRG